MLTHMPCIGDRVSVGGHWRHTWGREATVIADVSTEYDGVPIVTLRFPSGHKQDFHTHNIEAVIGCADPFLESVRSWCVKELN